MDTFYSTEEYPEPSENDESKIEEQEHSSQTQCSLPSTIEQLSLEELTQLETDEAEVTIMGRCDENYSTSEAGLCSRSSPDTRTSPVDPSQVVIATRIDDNGPRKGFLFSKLVACRLTVQTLILIAVGISVGIIISFVITYKATVNSNGSDVNATTNPILGEYIIPSISPSAVSENKQDGTFSNPKLSPELNYLIHQIESFTDFDSLESNETALGMAFQWIKDQENNANDTIVEKFTLATIYLSTGWAVNNIGNIDTGQRVQLEDFSNQHFCEWKAYSHGIWKGVTKCDNENKIESLDLCKCPFSSACMTPILFLMLYI